MVFLFVFGMREKTNYFRHCILLYQDNLEFQSATLGFISVYYYYYTQYILHVTWGENIYNTVNQAAVCNIDILLKKITVYTELGCNFLMQIIYIINYSPGRILLKCFITMFTNIHNLEIFAHNIRKI